MTPTAGTKPPPLQQLVPTVDLVWDQWLFNTLSLLTQMMETKRVHVRFNPKAAQVFPKASLV